MLDFIEKERDYVTKMLNKTMEKEAGILSEPVSIILGSKKKFVRPTLTLLACQAVGGAVNVAWPAALAVELVHNASIVSDDLIDDDAVRRGVQTIHKQFGNKMAILVSGKLFSLAFNYLAKINIPYLIISLSQTIKEMFEGEAYEIYLRRLTNPREIDAIRVMELKTASLFRFASGAGAFLGKGTPAQIKCFESYGLNMGVAFQIRDDYLGVFGKEEDLGKPVGTDLERKEKTLLMVHAIQNASPEDKKYILDHHEKGDYNLDKVKEIFIKSGAVNYLEDKLKEYLEKATNALEPLEKNIFIDKMIKLSNFNLQRGV